jgi:hypothetical protein
MLGSAEGLTACRPPWRATPQNPDDDHPLTVQNYKLVDEQGNAYKWWGTDKVIAVGNSVTIEHAEIVKHEVYDGITFTVITRCRIAK